MSEYCSAYVPKTSPCWRSTASIGVLEGGFLRAQKPTQHSRIPWKAANGSGKIKTIYRHQSPPYFLKRPCHGEKMAGTNEFAFFRCKSIVPGGGVQNQAEKNSKNAFRYKNSLSSGWAKRIVRFWGGKRTIVSAASKTSFGGLRKWDLPGLCRFPLRKTTGENKRGGGENVS